MLQFLRKNRCSNTSYVRLQTCRLHLHPEDPVPEGGSCTSRVGDVHQSCNTAEALQVNPGTEVLALASKDNLHIHGLRLPAVATWRSCVWET